MSDAQRQDLRERILAAEARQSARDHGLQEDGNGAVDRLTSVAREHPLLLIAGGLAVGALLSTLIPRSPTRRMSKNALGWIATIAEFGIAYGRQAMEAAEDAGQSGKAKIAALLDHSANEELTEDA